MCTSEDMNVCLGTISQIFSRSTKYKLSGNLELHAPLPTINTKS